MKRAFLVLAGCALLFACVVPNAMAAVAKLGPVVKLGESQFGPVLFSGGDRALYLFTRDPRNRRAATATAPRRGRLSTPRAGRGPARASIATCSARSSAAENGAR